MAWGRASAAWWRDGTCRRRLPCRRAAGSRSPAGPSSSATSGSGPGTIARDRARRRSWRKTSGLQAQGSRFRGRTLETPHPRVNADHAGQSIVASPRWIASARAVKAPDASCSTSGGAMLSGALDPLTPATSSRCEPRSARGWTASSASAAEPTPDRRQDRGERVGAMDHDETPSRREQREAGDDPGFERRSGASRARRHVRASAGRVGRGANRPASKNGGLATTRSASPSTRPASRRPAASSASAATTRARALEAVERGVFARQRGEPGVDLDEVAARLAASAGGARGRPRRPRRRRRRVCAPARPPPRRAAPRRRRRDGRRAAGAARNRPPRIASRLVGASPAASAIAQFAGEAGVAHQPSRPLLLVRVDQDPPRQEAERAFDRAHVLVGDEERHARLRQQRLDERRSARDHWCAGVRPRRDLRALRPRPCRARLGVFMVAALALWQGKRPWELSFRSRKSRRRG